MRSFLLLLAACGAADPEGGDETVRPASRDDLDALQGCDGGERSCVDLVIAALQDQVEALGDDCDHHAPFALAYLRTTESIRDGLDDEELLQDPARIIRQDVHFVDAYFEAWDLWVAGDLEALPESWRIAFESSAAGLVNAAGDAALGTNAHVQRDLPFVLDAIGSVAADGRADHDAMNHWLEPIYDPMLEELDQGYDPIVSELPSVPYSLLKGWRDKAWEHAEALGAAEDEAARAEVAAAIEAYAADQTGVLLTLASQRDNAARDAWCREGGVGAD